MVAANRILLTNTSKSFFGADILYHRCSSYNFRSPWWTSNKSIHNESEQNNSNDYTLLYKLVEYHINNKHDIHTMSQLCSFYHNTTNSKIRSIDLKKKLQGKFKEKLKFVKPSCVNWNSSEYIMSSCDKLIAEYVQAANLGERIKKAVMIKSLSRLISDEIRANNLKKLWPPTPQDTLNDTSMKNANLYNLIGSIIDLNTRFNNDGFVKLSKSKSIKVMKICDDIMTLIPTLQPALGQVLLSLKTYHKTGSSTIVDDLHKLGHGISYTATRFIENKWVKWSSNQSTIISSNVHKGISTTHVVDNIDWKNKDLNS